MATRVFLAICACLLLTAPVAAITVRFDTNVGNIDMVLNPTDNPNLANHVENMLRYIDSGRYDRVVLNRAADQGAGPADDFVLQFGGFTLGTQQFSSFNAFTPVESFGNVVVDSNNDGNVDFDVTNLKNLRGTVSLALSNSPNSGTSSFFVNLGDNTGLDAQDFVPFAQVVDMSTVDYILRLSQVSDNSAGLASQDIPVINEDNLLVFVERASCLDCGADEELMMMLAETAITDESAPASNGGSSASSGASSAAVQSIAIPEPPALVLAVGAFMVFAIFKGPRRY